MFTVFVSSDATTSLSSSEQIEGGILVGKRIEICLAVRVHPLGVRGTMPRGGACYPFRVTANVATIMLVALSATPIVAAAAKAEEAAGEDVAGVVGDDGRRAANGGEWSSDDGEDSMTTSPSVEEEEGNTRPSVALIFDVTGVNDGYAAERATLWQGVAYALSAEGKERVTVLLATDENVSRRDEHTGAFTVFLVFFGFFNCYLTSSFHDKIRCFTVGRNSTAPL